MKTIDIDPDAMRARIVRGVDLRANKDDYAEASGVSQGAYEMVSVRNIFTLLAPAPAAEAPASTHPSVVGPDGSALYVVDTPPGDGPALHAHMKTWETFMPLTGPYEFSYGDGGRHKTVIEPFELISLPPGTLRAFRNIGDHDARMLVLIQGDMQALNDLELPPDVGEAVTVQYGAEAKRALENIGMSFTAGV